MLDEVERLYFSGINYKISLEVVKEKYKIFLDVEEYKK
jgi:hypothetical protein